MTALCLSGYSNEPAISTSSPPLVKNWVRNLRAVGTLTITQGKHSASYVAERVQGEEAALVLRDCLAAYLPSPLAGPMLRQRISVNAEAPLDALALEARRTPVFRLTEVRDAR